LGGARGLLKTSGALPLGLGGGWGPAGGRGGGGGGTEGVSGRLPSWVSPRLPRRLPRRLSRRLQELSRPEQHVPVPAFHPAAQRPAGPGIRPVGHFIGEPSQQHLRRSERQRQPQPERVVAGPLQRKLVEQHSLHRGCGGGRESGGWRFVERQSAAAVSPTGLSADPKLSAERKQWRPARRRGAEEMSW
jgi:hypothetical protein